MTYDARGNGDGCTVCTITGDHNGHISDYTALVVESYGLSADETPKVGKEVSPTLRAERTHNVAIIEDDSIRN